MAVSTQGARPRAGRTVPEGRAPRQGRTARRVGLAIVASVCATAAAAQMTVETFEGGVNVAAWTISGSDLIETTGGNPGFWLRGMVDTFGPVLANDEDVPSAFMGDFRADGVTTIRVDARTDSMDFPVCGWPFTLLLRDTHGTPGVDDDDFAYFWDPESANGNGELVAPCIGEGWVHYDFDVPSASTDPVPEGWFGGWAGDPENFRPGVDWNDVIVSVDRVEVWWGAPPLLAIFQNWDVGVDNVAIGDDPSIFVDGFESGTTAAWDQATP